MKVKLGEVAEIIMGQSPDSSSYNYEDGLPFFQGNADFGEYYPTIRILCNKPKKIANKYDVLISVRAPVGAVNIANNTCAIGRGLAIIRTNANTVNHRYLFYLLKYHRRYIENLGTGSTFKAISKPILNDLCFTIHDIQTQKEIVVVLDKVTSLISMRKEQLEKLDILVKSKFIEMFGDNVIASQYSIKISDIALKIGDGLHGTPNYDETGIYAFINGNNLDNGKININKNTKFININEYNRLRKNISNNTILLSINGTLGKLAYYNGEEVALGKSVCYIDLKDSINRVFFYHVLNSNIFQQYLENNANKSTIKNVNLEKIRNCNIFIPPLDLQNKFAEFVEQVEKNKEKIKSSLNQLETLYNALMQEYFG